MNRTILPSWNSLDWRATDPHKTPLTSRSSSFNTAMDASLPRKTLNLYEEADRRQYDLECMMAAWRRQDDVEKSMDGYRRYIEDVVRGRREITMPHRLSLGYRRQPVVDACGNVQILANSKVRTELALDENLIETMHAFRRTADVHSDASRLARALNDAHLPGPNRYRPIGQQRSRQAIWRMVNQDLYAGVWTPG